MDRVRRRRISMKAFAVIEEENRLQFIPEEMVMAILVRLPLKSLLRFRCVSKQWISLISQLTTRVQKVLISCDNSFRSIDQNARVEDIDISRKTRLSGNKDCIHGSCNGLLLIGFSGDLFLWNPSTLSCGSHWPSSYDPHRTLILGLCFGSHKNDYKVLKVSTYGSRGRSVIESVVGSFRTSSWKHVEFWCTNPIESFQSGPVLNNHPHWWSSSSSSSSHFSLQSSSSSHSCDIILYFDSETDKFVYLPVPSPHKDEGSLFCVDSLGVLDGCLCMTRSFRGNSPIQVLVMKEYGVKESWTPFLNLHIKGLFSVVPLFFRNDDDGKKREVVMLLRNFYSGKIIAYDTDNNVYKDIAVGGFINGYVYPVVYEETVMTPPIWRRNALSIPTEEEEETAERTRPMHEWKV